MKELTPQPFDLSQNIERKSKKQRLLCADTTKNIVTLHRKKEKQDNTRDVKRHPTKRLFN